MFSSKKLTPSESPSIYVYIASIYMVCRSIYHVFLEKTKKRICKIMYNLGNSNSRSHADRKAALTTAPRALIPDCVCARDQYG